MKHRTLRRLIGSVLVAALTASACGGEGIVDVASFEKTLTWGACTGKDAPSDPYECATLTVPADYRMAEGDTIDIALVRLPATDGEPQGIILTNPGGPGGSGIGFISSAGREVVDSLSLEKFDLVGFDPRGVGDSDGVRCLTDKELDQYLYFDDTPDTPEEQKIDDISDKYDEACTEKYGSKLQNYSTEYAARDMDLIRASMGFEKLHFLGISYGTYLGGVYATLFPERLESMFLDSAFDPQGDTLEQEYTTQAVGFEKAFKNWTSWCQSKKDECAFSSSDVKKDWLFLYDKLDKKSLLVGKRDVNHRVLKTATKSALYAESAWPQLAEALAAAKSGDGKKLLNMADSYHERNEDGTYSSENEAYYVISCASGMGRQEPDDPKALTKKLKSVAPWYYRDLKEEDFDGGACEDEFGSPKLIKVSYKGDAPIVVLGGKNDPATPFRWAEEMTKNLGKNARLLTFSGEGHSQILVSVCVDDTANELFNEGTLPKAGKICKPNVPLEQPSWWKNSVAISGDLLDQEVLNGYFGFNPARTYVQYFSMRGSITSNFGNIVKSLESKGFKYYGGNEEDPTKSAQWFADEMDNSKSFGLIVSSEQELKKYSMAKPDGIVPLGTFVIAVFYFPPKN